MSFSKSICIGQKNLLYNIQAVEKYHEWEAFAKALSLENYLEEVVAR